MQRETVPWRPLPGDSGPQGREAEIDAFPVFSALMAEPADGAGRQSLSSVLRGVRRIRADISNRKTIRVRDIDRLRLLGVHPFGRCRIFRVASGSDNILAIWSGREGERPLPHWSEITRSLEKIERVIDRAMVAQ